MRPLRAVLHVTLFVTLVSVLAGPVLAAPPGGSGVAEPAGVAKANEAGRADNPCYAVPPPPPAPLELEPPGPDATEAEREAYMESRAAAQEAAGGVDPNEVPPPPPAPLELEPPPCAFRIAGGKDYLQVNEVVCDITKPFTVTGGKIKVHFTPSSGDPLGGGTYRYSGDFGKFSVAGQGTYKVRLTEDGGSIVAKGPGTATTPRGTFSGNGKEQYDLTPASC